MTTTTTARWFKRTKTIYEYIYDRIIKLIDPTKDYEKFLSSRGDVFMPLSVEIIRRAKGYYEVAIAHYYEQNGDLMADPMMIVKVRDHKMAEALTYQQDSMGVYQEVYVDENRYYPKLRKELNGFLLGWLKNLEKQWFYLKDRHETNTH